MTCVSLTCRCFQKCPPPGDLLCCAGHLCSQCPPARKLDRPVSREAGWGDSEPPLHSPCPLVWVSRASVSTWLLCCCPWHLSHMWNMVSTHSLAQSRRKVHGRLEPMFPKANLSILSSPQKAPGSHPQCLHLVKALSARLFTSASLGPGGTSLKLALWGPGYLPPGLPGLPV